MKAMTVEETRNYWNRFADYYGSKLEEPNLSGGLTLCNMLEIGEATNILEVGCGSGRLSLHWLKNLPSGKHYNYTSVDLSDEMVKFAQHRKEEASKAGKVNQIDHRFVQGNAEKLDFIPDEGVDLVIAPLIYHLVENADNALKEAFRVLKKGGKFGMSVLGPLEQNTFFTLFSDTMKRLHIEQSAPKNRSVHYLGEKETLTKLVESCGFKVDFCWSQDTAIRVFDDKDMELVLGVPRVKAIMDGLSQEDQNRMIEGMKEAIHQHRETKEPFKTNDLLLIARKPE